MKKRNLNLLLCVFSYLLFPLVLSAQQQEFVLVRGKVTEAETGEPLPGVSIVVDKSTRGVITDVDGTFEIRVLPSDKLIFSFIGMESQTIEVGDKTYFEIVMSPVAIELEEFAVVAYGLQKKESVVGSISTVEVNDLKVPTRSLANTLGGRLAGIISVQRSGEPGFDDAQFWIRGISTFGAGSSPLVLVDGIERSLSNIEPEEIESVSVLKDASATAMYGIRGANGVILINTRKGTAGKPTINIKTEVGYSGATRLPEIADAPTTLELYNEANLNTNPNFQTPYTPEIIELYRNQSDPELYPDVDWIDLMIKDWARNERININISGGGEVAKYFVSATYYNEEGIWKGDKLYNYNTNTNLNRYNFRANTDIKLHKYTNLNLGVGGYLVSQNFPGRSSDQIWDAIMHAQPAGYLPTYPDPDGSGFVFGGSGNEAIRNPYADLVNTGFQTTWNNNIMSNLTIQHDASWLTQGLKVAGMFSFDATNYHNIQRTRNYGDMYRAIGRDENGELILTRYLVGQEDLSFAKQSTGNRKIYLQANLNYDRSFGDHTLSGLLLYNQQEYVDASANNSIDALPYRFQGLVGRLSYSYQDKYFAEVNAGYNGSENFKKNERFGFFPSFALGWIISNEDFFREHVKFLDYLKLRGSFGYKGNDDIGGRRFAYLTTVGGGNGGYQFGASGENSYGGRGEDEYGADLTWEREEEINLGLETRFKGFYLQADIFKRYRTGIFMRRNALPDILGLTNAPWGNLGIMDNKGIDATLEYRKMIGNVDVSIRGNYTFARNKVIENDEPLMLYTYQSTKGLRYGQPFGLIAERLYVEDDFVDPEAGILKNYLPQPNFGNKVKPGDIKYIDINGDRVLNTYDRVAIGNPANPEIVYGFGSSIGYKGFDFSAFFQGTSNMDFMLGGTGFYPFLEDLNRQSIPAYATDRWSPDNPNQNVLFPRLSYGENPNNYQASTWWQRSASYLRLKSIELGYSLPKNITDKFGVSMFRLYLVGYNMFTWSNFKYWDPELGSGNGARYPIQRNVSIGINMNF